MNKFKLTIAFFIGVFTLSAQGLFVENSREFDSQSELYSKELQQKKIAEKIKIVKARKNTFVEDSFEVDGIKYNITSTTDRTAEVTSKTPEYSGSVAIPTSIKYNGEEYAVTAIGEGAFSGCAGLTSINIPSSVISIKESAFYYCTGLISVHMGNNIKSIEDRAFYSCTGLVSIDIPDNVTTIGSKAFAVCTNFTSVVVGNSVTSIGMGAFSSCSKLTSVIIPASVETIGYGTFDSCSNLKEIEVDDSNTVYCSVDGVLYNKEQTTLIRCPSKKSGAFIIPNGVQVIGGFSLEGCDGLTMITIPSSVTSIEQYAFSGCTTLSEVMVEWDTPIVVDSKVFNEMNLLTITLKVPEGTQINYKTAEVWKDFDIVAYTPSGINNTIVTSTTIYPNPFTNGFWIKGEERVVSITLLDINGKHLLYRSDITPESYIAMDNLPAGLYILNIQTESGEQREKLIKR